MSTQIAYYFPRTLAPHLSTRFFSRPPGPPSVRPPVFSLYLHLLCRLSSPLLEYNNPVGCRTVCRYGEELPFSGNVPMSEDTLFDLASLTKVVATTSATMVVYEKGFLPLDTKVMDVLGKDFAVNGKESITVSNAIRCRRLRWD